MKKFAKLPLRRRLVISYAAVVFTALTVFALFFILRYVFTTSRQIIFSLTESAPSISAILEKQMREIDIILSSLHAEKNIQKSLQGRPGDAVNEENEAKTAADLSSVSESLLMADLFRARTKSIQVFAANKPNYPEYNRIAIHHNIVFTNAQVKDSVWYRETISANGTTRWFYSTEDDKAGIPSIFASRTIINTSRPSETLGVLRAVIDPEQFLEPLDKSTFVRDGRALLFVDGSPVGENARALMEDEQFRSLVPALLSGKGGSASNGAYIAASSRVEPSGWYVITLAPKSAIYADIQPYVFTVLLIWLFLLVTGILFGTRISSAFSRPINRLSREMVRFNAQNSPISDDGDDEEIGRLYKSFNTMVTRINDLIEREKQAERRKKQAEIRILQAQINPHFMYNTLESIKALAVTAGNREVAEMVAVFGDFLRRSLNGGKHYTTIENEIRHAQAYVEVQKMRYRGAFSMETDVDPSILPLFTVNIILQPLIENSIQHGFADLDGEGRILLTGRDCGDEAVLTVSDNGTGADLGFLSELIRGDQPPEDDRYYCIRNVWMRLSSFFSRASMKFSTGPLGGLSVELRFEKVFEYREPDAQEKEGDGE